MGSLLIGIPQYLWRVVEQYLEHCLPADKQQ